MVDSVVCELIVVGCEDGIEEVADNAVVGDADSVPGSQAEAVEAVEVVVGDGGVVCELVFCEEVREGVAEVGGVVGGGFAPAGHQRGLPKEEEGAPRSRGHRGGFAPAGHQRRHRARGRACLVTARQCRPGSITS